MHTKTDENKFFQMRCNESFLRDLDNLRKAEQDLPSRAEMMRRLVERATASRPQATSRAA